jgi:hypothetical protein
LCTEVPETGTEGRTDTGEELASQGHFLLLLDGSIVCVFAGAWMELPYLIISFYGKELFSQVPSLC